MRLRRMGLPPALGLLLLSALWALGTLRTELFPRFGSNTVSHALGQAVFFSIFAVVAACIAVVRRVEFPRGRSAWACAGVGLGLFLFPATLLAWAQGELSTLDPGGRLLAHTCLRRCSGTLSARQYSEPRKSRSRRLPDRDHRRPFSLSSLHPRFAPRRYGALRASHGFLRHCHRNLLCRCSCFQSARWLALELIIFTSRPARD
jgi:hypothetical protein